MLISAYWVSDIEDEDTYIRLTSGEMAGIVIGCIAVSVIVTCILIRSIRSCKNKTQNLSNDSPNDDNVRRDKRLATGQSDKDDNNSVSGQP
jgi:hypothetical protein